MIELNGTVRTKRLGVWKLIGDLMAWWKIISGRMNVGDELLTPGRGGQGFKRRPLTILETESSKMILGSGRSKIKLEKECFDAIEKAFSENPILWLRVAALHANEPAKGSVDELVSQGTGSQLARGNYICSILEHCRLVRYAMRGNKKGIEIIGERETGYDNPLVSIKPKGRTVKQGNK